MYINLLHGIAYRYHDSI